MLKYLVIISILFCGTAVFAQTPVIINQPYDFQKWVKVKDSLRSARLIPDSTLQLPTGCGAPSGTASLKGGNRKKSAIYRDSCGKKTYVFEPSDSTWSIVGGGGGGLNMYNSDSTIAGNRIITQAGRYLRFQQSSIDYTQFNGALQTIQPDSTSVPFYTKIIKSPYAGSTSNGMLEWREGFGFGDQTPGRPNYPYMRGWNLAAGGTSYVAGLPAIGESWEPHYLPDGTSPTLWLMEYHKFYITPAGAQMRLESWTINTRDNNYNAYYKTSSVSWRDSLETDYLFATTAYRGDRTTQLTLKSGNGTTETQFIAGGAEDATEIRSVSNGQFKFSGGWTNLDFGNGNGYNVTDNMWGIGQVSQGFNIVRATHPWGLHYKNSAASADAAAFTVDGNTAEVQNYVGAGGYYATYYSNGSERMRLSAGGNMLIGTTTDNGAKLQVNGSAYFGATNDIIGTATNNNATAGNIGEEVSSYTSTYANFTTTATYQAVDSITLTAGDWDISAQATFSSNGATITAASDAIFVISTTRSSASGSTEGKNIIYVPQSSLLGTSHQSISVASYRVSLSSTTKYYLNAQSTFTVGNPQYVGGIRARRMR